MTEAGLWANLTVEVGEQFHGARTYRQPYSVQQCDLNLAYELVHPVGYK